MSTIGVPTKLLQEALGHVITVEFKSGQVYRGKLYEGEQRHVNETRRRLMADA